MSAGDVARQFAEEYSCPSCGASKEASEQASGVIVLVTRHAANCARTHVQTASHHIRGASCR